MIITVTMNPAIDKTVEVSKFIYGSLNRIQKVEYDAGGKGINVSKTICELGGQSIATGFIAGNNGQTIVNVLKAKGIDCDFVEVEGETRTNTKVVESDGTLTELNEPGPCITEKKLLELKDKLLEYAKEGNVFVFAGSVPAGIPKTIYGELISIVKEKRAKVLLDVDSASLLKAADKFRKKGVKNIVVSMGDIGGIFLLEDYQMWCPGLKVEVHSTVGAGDAMVVALSYAEDNQLEREDVVRLCMAVSAGAVTTIGTKPPSKEVVDEFIKQVTIKEIGE